jgi:DNA-binding PadR family transcriptional regulator
MRIEDESVEAALPLPPATFHILLALTSDVRHGYAIIQDVADRTNGELRMSAGTLYRSVARMVEQGLITRWRSGARSLTTSGAATTAITPFGTAVARAEMRRLTDLVRLARASGLKPRPA